MCSTFSFLELLYSFDGLTLSVPRVLSEISFVLYLVVDILFLLETQTLVPYFSAAFDVIL
jgi:hypothetical protein